jgi:hypothetical protein
MNSKGGREAKGLWAFLKAAAPSALPFGPLAKETYDAASKGGNTKLAEAVAPASKVAPAPKPDKFMEEFIKQAEAAAEKSRPATTAPKAPGILRVDEQIRKAEEERDRLRKQIANGKPEKIGMPALLGGAGAGEAAKAIQNGIAEAAKGTFSSYGAGLSLGIGDKIQEKIKTAAEKTAENTGKIADAMKDGGMQWF